MKTYSKKGWQAACRFLVIKSRITTEPDMMRLWQERCEGVRLKASTLKQGEEQWDVFA